MVWRKIKSYHEYWKQHLLCFTRNLQFAIFPSLHKNAFKMNMIFLLLYICYLIICLKTRRFKIGFWKIRFISDHQTIRLCSRFKDMNAIGVLLLTNNRPQLRVYIYIYIYLYFPGTHCYFTLVLLSVLLHWYCYIGIVFRYRYLALLYFYINLLLPGFNPGATVSALTP